MGQLHYYYRLLMGCGVIVKTVESSPRETVSETHLHVEKVQELPRNYPIGSLALVTCEGLQ
jgi:hypothetical protein